MYDLNASVRECLHGAFGPYGLEGTTSDNGDRLVSFACANSLCLTNTFFAHKCIYQVTPEPGSHPTSMTTFW